MAAAPPLSAQPPQLVRDFWPGEVVSGLLNHGRPMAFRLHGDDLLVFANDGNGAAKLFRLNDLSGNVQELAHVGAPAGYTTTNGGIITSDDNIYFFAQQAGSTNHLLWCVRPGQAAEQLMTHYHTPSSSVMWVFRCPEDACSFPATAPTTVTSCG